MDDVERAARALCALDKLNPDARVETGKMVSTRSGNSVSLDPETVPQWHKLRPEAERFVAMLQALSDMT